MNILKISSKSLRANPLTAGLNILLIAFGIGISTLLLLASDQVGKKLDDNAKDIDLVVGAKGSPLQLILSSVFYVDFPTGNILLKDAELVKKNPMVKMAVPLALGDNYQGYRIAGTDSTYISLYDLKLAAGRFWKNDLEVTVGANVAETQHLKVGSKFFGAHGLTGNGDIHKQHAYVVAGVLAPKGNVTDNVVLTNVGSVWKMHETKEEHPDGKPEAYENGEREITSLLIQYRLPTAIVVFPRMINQSTNMQAASPAIESARLFSLIGVGVDTLQWFAILIMAISAISVFVSLYNSLKERKYDLAIMRTMGSSKMKLFMIVIAEGAMLTLVGAAIGLALGHLCLQLIGHYQDSSQARLTGMVFKTEEVWLLLIGFGIGALAALMPAIQAYRSNISKILAQN